jgi:hypothetical protein
MKKEKEKAYILFEIASATVGAAIGVHSPSLGTRLLWSSRNEYAQKEENYYSEYMNSMLVHLKTLVEEVYTVGMRIAERDSSFSSATKEVFIVYTAPWGVPYIKKTQYSFPEGRMADQHLFDALAKEGYQKIIEDFGKDSFFNLSVKEMTPIDLHISFLEINGYNVSHKKPLQKIRAEHIDLSVYSGFIPTEPFEYVRRIIGERSKNSHIHSILRPHVCVQAYTKYIKKNLNKKDVYKNKTLSLVIVGEHITELIAYNSEGIVGACTIPYGTYHILRRAEQKEKSQENTKKTALWWSESELLVKKFQKNKDEGNPPFLDIKEEVTSEISLWSTKVEEAIHILWEETIPPREIALFADARVAPLFLHTMKKPFPDTLPSYFSVEYIPYLREESEKIEKEEGEKEKTGLKSTYDARLTFYIKTLAEDSLSGV